MKAGRETCGPVAVSEKHRPAGGRPGIPTSEGAI